MKYSLNKLLRDDTNILSHIFLNAGKEVLKEIKKKSDVLTRQEKEESTIDITLTIEGHEIDPQEWYQGLWNQLCDLARKKATEMVKEQTSEKFRNMTEKLYEYEKIIDSWAEEINWDIENPLIKK